MEFCIEDGVLWDFKYDNVQGNIFIPHGVRVIGEGAFAQCPSLSSVIIPDTVERIEREAFFDCPELTRVLIPDSVKYIGTYAFADCRQLNNVSIPESVTDIDPFAFWIYKAWDEYLPGGPYYVYGKRGGVAEQFAKQHPFIFRENKADEEYLMVGGREYEWPDLTPNRDGNIVLISLNGYYEWGITDEGYPFARCWNADNPYDRFNFFNPIPWIDLYTRIDEMILLARSNGFTDWSDEYERIKKMVLELPKTDPDLLKAADSGKTMPEAERYAAGDKDLSRELLWRAAQEIYAAYDYRKNDSVIVVCGSGSSACIGYALAEVLYDHSIKVDIYNVCKEIPENGAYFFKRCKEKNIPVREFFDIWYYDVFVDCLHATGSQDVPDELAAEVIRDINYARECYGRVVISVDINSGIDGDTGEADLAIVSNLTVSIGSVRKGLLQPHTRELIGKLAVADLDMETP